MTPRRRTLVVPVLLAAAATATLALAQDHSDRSQHSDHSDRSSRSDHSSRSDRSDRESRHSSRSSRGSSSHTSYAAAAAASPTSQPTSFLDGYRLVLDRNIFSRNRVIYRDPSSASSSTAPSRSSYRSLPALTLTGVTKETGVATALIEDRRTNQTLFHHVGDPIADGRITAINLDSLEYLNAAGQTVRVDIGHPFENGPTYSVSSSSSSSSSFGPAPTASPSASPTPSSGGDSNDILERLRQKRLQETKR